MDTEWLESAICKGKHIDFWYPPLDVPNASSYYDVGRQLCERCPVWNECLEYGREETVGMWGGLTPLERRVLLGGRGTVAPHGSVTRYRQGCSCAECENVANRQRSRIELSTIPDIGEELNDIDTIRDLVLCLLNEPVVERAGHLRPVTD